MCLPTELPDQPEQMVYANLPDTTQQQPGQVHVNLPGTMQQQCGLTDKRQPDQMVYANLPDTMQQQPDQVHVNLPGTMQQQCGRTDKRRSMPLELLVTLSLTKTTVEHLIVLKPTANWLLRHRT